MKSPGAKLSKRKVYCLMICDIYSISGRKEFRSTIATIKSNQNDYRYGELQLRAKMKEDDQQSLEKQDNMTTYPKVVLYCFM